MIEDAGAQHHGALLRADVCVVGAGPAGITLALALSGQGLQVLLLEAGRHPLDPAAQALYAGELANPQHCPPDRYRARGLGGSSILWGGRCMPLDPIDFERRPWVPYSGWPITFEALWPHYVQANALAEAGRCVYDAGPALGPLPPLIAGLASDTVCASSLERFSCPTDFGRRYERRLRVTEGLRVLRGAVCTAIRLAADGRSVERLDLASLAGHAWQVQARAVVLALGGLETARLLLHSQDVAPWGVGNRHDVVGRYYMCHIAGNVGRLRVHGPTSDVRHGYEIAPEGVYCRRRLSVVASAQRRLGLLNAVARLHFPPIPDPAHGSGVLSGLYLARPFIRYEYGRRLHGAPPAAPAQGLRHLLNVLRDAPQTAAFLTHWLRRRTWSPRKFPSVILSNRSNRFSLEVQGEQRPDPASRVVLGERVDALGMRRLRIDWRYHPEDIASLDRTLQVIACELARCGVGRLEVDRDRLEEDLLAHGAYGGHHLGTARMGLDPRTSVVDADCKVHEVDNLYVAGSAVFPTSSQANPTLTVLALALRLAQHLGGRLQARTPRALEVSA